MFWFNQSDSSDFQLNLISDWFKLHHFRGLGGLVVSAVDFHAGYHGNPAQDETIFMFSLLNTWKAENWRNNSNIFFSKEKIFIILLKLYMKMLQGECNFTPWWVNNQSLIRFNKEFKWFDWLNCNNFYFTDWLYCNMFFFFYLIGWVATYFDLTGCNATISLIWLVELLQLNWFDWLNFNNYFADTVGYPQWSLQFWLENMFHNTESAVDHL